MQQPVVATRLTASRSQSPQQARVQFLYACLQVASYQLSSLASCICWQRYVTIPLLSIIISNYDISVTMRLGQCVQEVSLGEVQAVRRSIGGNCPQGHTIGSVVFRHV